MLANGANAPIGAQQTRDISFACIELLNLWAELCRSYYLSCALGTKDSAGLRITHNHPNIRSKDDAVALSVQTINKRARSTPPPYTAWDEPTWHERSTFSKVMRSLGSDNLAQIQAALSIPNRVLVELPIFRNFFAHRSESTARKTQNIARAWRLNPDRHPVEILIDIPPGRQQSLIEEYADELRLIIDAL